MKISDKLKGAIGMTLTVLFIGAVGANYIEGQNQRTSKITTYDELVKRSSHTTARTTAESSAAHGSISIGAEGSPRPDVKQTTVTIGKSESAQPEIQVTTATTGKSEDSQPEIQVTTATTDKSEDSQPEIQVTTATTGRSENSQPEASVVITTTAGNVSNTEAIASDEPQHDYTEHDEAEQITVYVSSTGKYHARCNCSGMKNYTEMTLQQAVEAGLSACKRCW